VSELEVIRVRYVRYLVASLVLIGLAMLLTITAMKVKSMWLMVLALSLLLVSFALLFMGLTLRAEHKLMRELRGVREFRSNSFM